jgi:large-conductance mechanosensitive channel
MIHGILATASTSFVADLLGNYAFPIVVCVALFYVIMMMNKSHREETKEFAEALNKNTLVLQKLCDKLGIEGGDTIND